MKNSTYWKKRFEQLEDEQYRKTEKYYKDIEKQFRMVQNSIQMDIEKWYWRLADNNDISYAAAKKLLKKNELEEFHWTVEEYIKYGRENAIDQKWMKQLENASARVHIQKLEAIKIQMQKSAELLFMEYDVQTADFLKGSYADNFYHTAFEMAKGTGIGKYIETLDPNMIDKIIRKPWAQDGSNFSDRIWKNKEKLVNTLHTELSQCIIRGENPINAARRVAEQMNVPLHQAKTLVFTESATISSVARKDSMESLGVKQYEIVATLDSKTSDICREMDGKVFDMKDYQVGVTAPVFHPRCRSCTCPYFDDEFTIGEQRAARSEETGATYYVPADMKYPEWFKEYVVKPLRNVIIKTDKQFGKKVGKHTKEYNLDPSKQSDREKMKSIIDDILINYDEVVPGRWRGQEGDIKFYIKGDDVVVVNGNVFVTILKGGINNARVKNARKQQV